MKVFAIVRTSTGVVENTILWDGIEEWQPPSGTSAIETDCAAIGWSYSNGVFFEPVKNQPSEEEVFQANKTQKYNLMSNAAAAMKPLELAKDLAEATAEEEEELIMWGKYLLSVSRIDPNILSPEWPQWPGI